MMTNNKLWKTTFWALVLATLWLSLVPAEHIPSAFNFWDKAQHALGFAALAYCGLAGYARRTSRVVLGLVVFGMAIEVLQHLSGWRHGDWLDWVADCAGLSMGWLVRAGSIRWTKQRINTSAARQAK
jgi:VanZ family protein